MRFETSFPVRYYEADPMGVVHHSVYVRYFECARHEWLTSEGYLHQDCLNDNIVCPVVELSIKYKSSARYGEKVTAVAELIAYDTVTMVFHQEVLGEDGRLCAEGQVTVAFLNTKLGHPVRCPQRLNEIIKNQLNK